MKKGKHECRCYFIYLQYLFWHKLLYIFSTFLCNKLLTTFEWIIIYNSTCFTSQSPKMKYLWTQILNTALENISAWTESRPGNTVRYSRCWSNSYFCFIKDLIKIGLKSSQINFSWLNFNIFELGHQEEACQSFLATASSIFPISLSVCLYTVIHISSTSGSNAKVFPGTHPGHSGLFIILKWWKRSKWGIRELFCSILLL